MYSFEAHLVVQALEAPEESTQDKPEDNHVDNKPPVDETKRSEDSSDADNKREEESGKAEVQTPPKKKRGRPPKSDQTSEKKPRTVEPSMEKKRGPGRPRKSSPKIAKADSEGELPSVIDLKNLA